jgi:hypothetical protein
MNEIQPKHEIFAIGDSHSIFFHNSIKIKEHWIGLKLPITIYSLLKQNLDILNIGTILGNGHEKYNIKEYDTVIFFFGFNDIQRNIYLHAKNHWKKEIDILMTNYINLLINYKDIYKLNIIVPSIYPNPRPNAEGQNALGSFSERQSYCIYANNLLKNLCIKYNVHFLDIYNIISDENGFIKNDITIDNIHLDCNNNNIRAIIESKILDLSI